MKFSGWNASTPDKGLAPSMTAPTTTSGGNVNTSQAPKSNMITGQVSVNTNSSGGSSIGAYSSFNDNIVIDEETGNPMQWSDRISEYSVTND